MVMAERYFEMTFRRGRVLAAYLHLPRRAGQRCARSHPIEDGIVVDLASDGQPLGIEIVSPSKITAAAINRVLRGLGLPPMRRGEIPRVATR